MVSLQMLQALRTLRRGEPLLELRLKLYVLYHSRLALGYERVDSRAVFASVLYRVVQPHPLST